MSECLFSFSGEHVNHPPKEPLNVDQPFGHTVNTRVLPLIIFALVLLQFFHILFLGLLFCLFSYDPQKLQRRHPAMLLYPVKELIISPTTQIAFTNSMLTNMPICVKAWQRQRVKADEATQIQFLLEGFHYNQRCAPGVYLGFAYFQGLNESAETFQRGRLTFFPNESRLANGDYAIVMKTLDEQWRLDHHLNSQVSSQALPEQMRFLAQEVARIHKRATPTSPERGLPESIESKLKFNIGRFGEALTKLSQVGIDVSKYHWITEFMKRVCTDLKQDFEQRHKEGHIRRHHGDLKLTNLFIKPAHGISRQQLLALDCIDFNPDFFCIDSLSDVAMLAMDLQMHFRQLPSITEAEAQQFVETFRTAYLKEMNESEEDCNILLKYYVTEKTIVCAYVSILLDNELGRGEGYLELACLHAKELQELLPISQKHVQTLNKKYVLTRW